MNENQKEIKSKILFPNENQIEIENKIIEILTDLFKGLVITSKQTIDLLLKEENPSDLIALYNFYYYTAKWQKTNQPKATIKYVMKGLKWGEKKVRSRKRQLVGLGLIEDVRRKNKENKYLGWYIKINCLWSENTILGRMKTTLLEIDREESKTTLAEKNTVVLSGTNALNANSKMLKESAPTEKTETKPTPFETNSDFFNKGQTYLAIREKMASKNAGKVVDRILEDFISYWTEPNKTGTKVRWEQQSTFDVKRRIRTWADKENKWK